MNKRLKSSLKVVAAAMVVAATTTVQAAYPERPIRVVMPYPPGGGGDLLLRTLQPIMERELGQNIVIDYKAGAAGNIGAADVARAEPDGYTLLVAPTNNYVINQYLFKDMRFDPLEAFDPVSLLVEQPYLVLLPSALPVKNYGELKTYAQQNSGKLNYGSPGAGTVPHLSALMLADEMGANLVHVPYRGSHPALHALTANEIQLLIASYGIAAGQINAGMARPIAIASQTRLNTLPNVPTTGEAGIPDGIILANWWGMAAPKGTDPNILNRLAQAVRAAASDPEVKAKLLEQGSVAVASTPSEFAERMQREAGVWKGIIDKTGVTIGD